MPTNIKTPATTHTIGEAQGYEPLHISAAIETVPAEDGSGREISATVIKSVWQFSVIEAAEIAAGGRLVITLYGSQPPIIVEIV